jgi:sodium transport system permease protein
LKKAVQKGRVDLGLFAQILPDTNIQQERFTWFVDGTKEGLEERATAITQFFQLQHETQRLQQLGIRPEEIHPLQATYINCASQQKMMGQVIGGILPYIFIAFGFIGCMYPAIDLFTGEKERGTLETLLCAPIARWKILTGKMAVIVFSGLAAASFALIGIYISSEFLGLSLDKNITAEVMKVLEPQFLIYSLLLLLPLVVFFAGIMVPIAVSAKSFKEAQSMIGPLNMLVVLPAMVGFFPGFELNALTAMIPVVNVVLATKALLSGTLAWIYLVEALGVMLLLAALSVLFSYRQYGKESNLIN